MTNWFKNLTVSFLLLICTSVHANAQDAEEKNLPDKVTVGVYVNDIQHIDMPNHSYVVDMYVWFRWMNPDINPLDTFEFMNTFDPEAHVEEAGYDEPQPQPDGSLYGYIRHQGAFSTKFHVGKYPFDAHDLKVFIEDAEYSVDEMVFVPDENPLTLNPDIELPGYDIVKPRFEISGKRYDTNFGDLYDESGASYARFTVVIPIERPALSGGVKAFLPIFLIILCAALSLLLDPVHVEARVGLSITALLTLVATQFTAASNLPQVAYLTMLDQIYIASYIYILVVVSLVVRGTRMDEQGALQGVSGATEKLAKGGPLAAFMVTAAYVAVVILILMFSLI